MRLSTVRSWQGFYEDSRIKKRDADIYVAYVRRMHRNKLPPIFEFRHLSKLLGRTEQYMASVTNSPEAHYRTFRIPKRSGGFRTIDAPYPALLECQRWINVNILAKVELHKACHGFRIRKSILTNAKHHIGTQHLLKVDLEDFFPSIKLRRVIGLFRRFGYPPNVSFYLAQLCCCNGQLPQGAATSPHLSNIIAGKMDKRLYGLARGYGLNYTRYADDMTFSGPRISVKTVEIIQEIINEEGFRVNPQKMHLCRSRGKRIVTGISVSGESLTVPREYKRKVKQEIHYVLTYGLIAHCAKRRIRNPFYLESLYGKLLFWKWIEPQNRFVKGVLPHLRERLLGRL